MKPVRYPIKYFKWTKRNDYYRDLSDLCAEFSPKLFLLLMLFTVVVLFLMYKCHVITQDCDKERRKFAVHASAFTLAEREAAEPSTASSHTTSQLSFHLRKFHRTSSLIQSNSIEVIFRQCPASSVAPSSARLKASNQRSSAKWCCSELPKIIVYWWAAALHWHFY